MRLPSVIVTAAALLMLLVPDGGRRVAAGPQRATFDGLRQFLVMFPEYQATPFHPPREMEEATRKIVSPDGKWILYDREFDAPEGAGQISLRLLNRHGRLVRDVTKVQFDRCIPFCWSPDSRSLYFWSNERYRDPPSDRDIELWQGAVDRTSFRKRRFRWLAENELPVFSPTGEACLVLMRPDASRVGTAFVVSLRTGRRRRLCPADNVAWSPDGKSVLVLRHRATARSYPGEFFVVPAHGGNPRRVLSEADIVRLARGAGAEYGFIEQAPYWLADGRHFLTWCDVGPIEKPMQRVLACVRSVAGPSRLLSGLFIVSGSADGKHLLVNAWTGGGHSGYYLLDTK